MAAGGGRSPFQITLRAGERRFLKARACQATAPYRQVVRARIVLLAAAGLANAHIARKLGIAPTTAGKWRKRFWEEGIDGLADRKRPGRPRVFAAVVVTQAKAIAWSCPPPVGCRLAAGALPSCVRSCSRPASTTSRRPRCGAGWPRTRSGHGGITRGSSRVTPRLRPRPAEYLTCPSGCSRAKCWDRASASSAQMRRPRSRRAAAAIPPCRRVRPG